jgi:two-component system chemotaxis response regulator CheB
MSIALLGTVFMNQVKVLVLDYSALMRKLLVALLGQDKSIDVVGSAIDSFDARDKIKLLRHEWIGIFT